MQLVVTIPGTPRPDLSPNRPTGKTAKGQRIYRLKHAAAVKKARTLAKDQVEANDLLATWLMAMSSHWEPDSEIHLEWMVAWEKGHRIVDNDNLVNMLKPYQDGVADAIGINDKLFTTEIHSQYRDPDGLGYLRLIITPR